MNRQDIESFINATPPFDTDTYGETVRQAVINRLMGALPGHIVETDHIYLRDGGSWRGFFFPNYEAGPLHDEVDTRTGLDEAFWGGFSTALLCASIRQISHEVVKEIDSPKLDQALAAYNARLQEGTRLASLYARVLSSDWPPLARILSTEDKPSARSLFLETLVSPSWQAERRDLLRTNDWPNYDWDIFHYWIKLAALGADQATIDAAADRLADAIDLPPAVSAGQWGAFLQWMRPPSDPLRKGEISHAEFDAEATRGILTTRFTMSPARGGMSLPVQHETPEGYAFSFMLPGQPGDDYRVRRQNSCFGAGTPVLLADGGFRAIEELTPGSLVATPSGPAEVAVLVRTPRAGRPLFRIDGGSATFTEAHPFLSARRRGAGRRTAHFLAVSPALLGQTIPTLSWFGVDRLESGAKLRGWNGEAETTVTVASLTREEATAEETVYDVVVWPDRQSDCQYIVGNGERNLVVGAEMPLISEAPLAMRVLLALLLRLAPQLEPYATVAELASFETTFGEFLTIAAHQALPAALHRASREANGVSPLPVAVTLAEAVRRLNLGGGYDNAFGRAVAAVARSLGPAIDSAITLGFRRIGVPGHAAPEVLALSVHDIAFRKWARDAFEQPIDLAAALDGDAFSPTVEGSKPRPSDRPFLRRLNAVSYLDAPRPRTETIGTLRFAISAAGRPTFFGQAMVDLTPGQPLRRYSARLVDGLQTPVGRLSFDLRPLSKTDRAIEEADHARWNDTAMEAFAQRLAVALAEEATSLFAALRGMPNSMAETPS